MIIIGTGAGGGTLARHLAPSGKRILLLERGDWLPREPQNWLAQDVFVDNRYISPDTWYDAKGKPFQPQVHYFVGGATKLYGAALYRLREGGLRRAPPPRRHLARLADLLRRARAVLHAGRAALRGARRARRGSDRAAGERAVPVPGRLARAADPAALGRPRGRRLPPLPRAVRHQARRGEHAVQHVRPLRHLRRLPVPRARQVGRRGARRAAGARAPERHAADEREGRQARDERRRARPSPRSSSSATAQTERYAATSSSSPAARPTRPSCCSPRRATSTRTASPTAPTRSAATTCSTTARRCSRSRARRTRPSSRRRSGSTTSTSAATTSSTRSGNIQMVGKSQAPMFRGEKPGETRLAPEWTLERVARHAIDFWLSTEDLPRPENRVTVDRDGKRHAELHGDERGGQEAALRRSSSRCSGSST